MLRFVAALALVAAMAAPRVLAAGPTLVVTPSSGLPGATLSGAASGFTPGGPITLWWDKTVTLLGTKVADGAGAASFKFTIPLGASLGDHVVRACGGSFCPDGGFETYADDTVRVVSLATPKPTASPTPRPTRSPTPAPTSPSVTTSPVPTASAAPTGVTFSQPPLNPSFPVVAPTLPPPTVPVIPPVLTGAHTIPPGPDAFTEPIPDDFPDLWLTDMEITQGIQNLDNAMPLVASRRTYVRLYFRVDGDKDWFATYGALHATRNGQSLGWIWPEDGAMVAHPTGSDRLDPDTTLDFRLPEAWTHGTVTFTGFVYSWDPDTPWDKEPDADNNIKVVTRTFHEAEPLVVHYVTLHLHEQYKPGEPVVEFGPDPLSIFGAVVRTTYGFYRYHPIAQTNISIMPWILYPTGHSMGHEFDLGWCKTTITQASNSNVVTIADWSVLVDDPADVPEHAIAVDHDGFYIDGTLVSINTAYITDSGEAEVNTGHFFSPDDVGKEVAVKGCPLSGEMAEPNTELGELREYYDFADEREVFVGMIDPSLYGRFGGLSTGGTDSVWVRMNDAYTSGTPWRHASAATAAHEAGHAGGLKHVACKDSDGDGVPDEIKGGAIDMTHPETEDFPVCSLADEDPDGFFGFDVYHDFFLLDDTVVLSNDPTAPAGNVAYPFMSYKEPGWPDPYHYCRLLPYYGVPCDPDEVGIRWNHPVTPCTDCDPFTIPPLPPQPSMGPLVLITGSGGARSPGGGIAVEGSGLDLRTSILTPNSTSLWRLAVQRAADPAQTELWAVLRTADGRELGREPVAIDEHGHDATDTDPVSFRVIVELPGEAGGGGTNEIRLEDSAGNELGRVPVSPNAPTVDSVIVTPDPAGPGFRLDWKAHDADGDSLTYDVAYTPDGEDWQGVAVGLTDETFALDSFAGIPGSPGGRFRVYASDGVLSGYGDSAPIVVPNSAPEPIITYSPDGGFAALHGMVILEGQAFDLEDRALAGDALSWSSSIDGPLGTGVEVRTASLSAGTHTIVLTATDSDGASASASVQLSVDGSVIQVVSKPETNSEIDRIFEALDEGRSPAAGGGSIDEHPDFAWIPIGFGAGLLVLLALAGVAFMRARGGTSQGTWRPDILAINRVTMDELDQLAAPDGDAAAGQSEPPGDEPKATIDETLTVDGGQTEAAGKDMTLKGKKILDN